MIHSTLFALLALCLSLFNCQMSQLQKRAKFNAPDFVFDLDKSPASYRLGGSFQLAGIGQMPSLEQERIAFALFNIKPCGVLLPHIHPRATELIFSINATKLQVGFTEENGGRTIINNITTDTLSVLFRFCCWGFACLLL